MTARRVFSAIQPTGIPHLGNYFGSIANWIRIANDRKLIHDNKLQDCDTPIFSIADIHAYSSVKNELGSQLYDNILSTTASLLALGLDPHKCILFRQSDVLEHNYLNNVFHSFISTNRLSNMIQFKEKSKAASKSDGIVNSLLNYPVLQAADILLYKADSVPVGQDQIQHVELTRDIARNFNSVTKSDLFPIPQVLLEESQLGRKIKSLRDPTEKMSKSAASKKSFIEVIDEPEVIAEKLRKSLTDCTNTVEFDPENRPGVSNLIILYHLASGESILAIEKKFSGCKCDKLKLELSELLSEKFRSTREEYKLVRKDRDHLEKVLELGRDKAQPVAAETIRRVKDILGSTRSS